MEVAKASGPKLVDYKNEVAKQKWTILDSMKIFFIPNIRKNTMKEIYDVLIAL